MEMEGGNQRLPEKKREKLMEECIVLLLQILQEATILQEAVFPVLSMYRSLLFVNLFAIDVIQCRR